MQAEQARLEAEKDGGQFWQSTAASLALTDEQKQVRCPALLQNLPGPANTLQKLSIDSDGVMINNSNND